MRGAVLTSGYYIVPDAVKGGSTVHFVVQADPRAGAYTRPLLSSTSAVSDTKRCP